MAYAEPLGIWLAKKSCKNKKFYGTARLASNAAALLAIGKGYVLRPYKCRFCAGYHLTSQKS